MTVRHLFLGLLAASGLLVFSACKKAEATSGPTEASPSSDAATEGEKVLVVDQLKKADSPKSLIVPKADKLVIHADVEATEVTAEFKFTNTSDKAIRLTDLDSNCACLSAESPKTVYAPGEEGTLTAVFTLGERAGIHRKAAAMKTNEPGEPEVRFEVEVHIPEVFTLKPNNVKWLVGEKAATKVIAIDFVGEDPILITEISSTRPKQFDHELKELEKGRKYELHLTPKSTEAPVVGGIRIITDSKISKYTRRMAFFSVSKPTKPRPE